MTQTNSGDFTRQSKWNKKWLGVVALMGCCVALLGIYATKPEEIEGLELYYSVAWKYRVGNARQLAVGGGNLFAIGNSAVPGGYKIFFYDSGKDSWTWLKHGGGNRIAVDSNGYPWVVDSGGVTYKMNWQNDATTFTWTKMPGILTDISANDIGDVWAIGTHDYGGGNFGVFQWDSLQSNWENVPYGLGVKISISNAKVPYVLKKDGTITYYDSEIAAKAAAMKRAKAKTIANGENRSQDLTAVIPSPWVTIPGCATDIAAGGSGDNRSLWIVSCTETYPALGGNIMKWNTSTQNWEQTSGAATSIAIGPHGPFAVNKKGQIWWPNTNYGF